MLAKLYHCNIIHPNRVSNCQQNFNELNNEVFDFTNGFKCSDVHRFNELNVLSIHIFELNFYQDQIKWKHRLIPIKISKNKSGRVSDSLIHKKPYVLI